MLEQERLSRLERLNKPVTTTTTVPTMATTLKLDSPMRRDQRRLSENENAAAVTMKREESKDYAYLRRQNSEGDASLAEAITNLSIVAKTGVLAPQKDKGEPDVPVRITCIGLEKLL